MSDKGVRRRLKAERPTTILQAALEEFSLNGFAGARLDDVAARAGITKGTIYVYFPSKEDLFMATLKEKTRPVFENLQRLAAEPDGSALEVLRQHLAFVARHMVEDPCGRDIFRILIAEGHRFPSITERWFGEVMEPAIEAFAAIVRRGVARGEFQPGIAEQYPQLIMAPIFLYHNWEVLFGERRPLDPPRFLQSAFDLLANGLLRREGGAEDGRAETLRSSPAAALAP